ncbi:unnamed protein product [Symbiodinium sp. CCMP2456]|nr:unnamed protein product [Symbiodinium sp. CCMP2456]
MGSAAGKSKAAAQGGSQAQAAQAGDDEGSDGSLTVSVGFIDGSELTLTLPGGARHPRMGPRSLDELLRRLGEQMGYPQQYLRLTLGSRTFSQNDWECSLKELGVQEGSHLICVKSTPMSEALPASIGTREMRTSSSSEASKVSLYFELAAEGWRDFPWRGPVDVALQATVGDLWEDAQHILMEVAETAPPPRPGNPYDLRERLRMLMWGKLSFKRFQPAECLTLVHCCHGRPGSTSSEKVLAELRFPSGDGLKDGDCFSVYSAMD